MRYREWFQVETVTGKGDLPFKFETYEEAYAALCETYARELKQGFKPALYRIMSYCVSEYEGTRNLIIQPTWGL